MATIELIVKLFLLALLWAALASPLLAAAFFALRKMKCRGVTSRRVVLPFAVFVAVLVAPVPTPIITVFAPNVLALVDGTYYAIFIRRDEFFGHLLPWITTSLVVTSVFSYHVALRYIAASNMANIPSRQADV